MIFAGKIRPLLILIVFNLVSPITSAQTIGIHTFDQIATGEKAASSTANVSWAEGISGLTFTSSGGTSLFTERTINVSVVASSRMLSFERTSGWFGSSTVLTVNIKSTSGNDFELTSLAVSLITQGSKTVKFEGFRDGASTGSTTQNISSSISKTTVTLPEHIFSNIDAVNISGFESDGIRIDDIVLAAPNIPTDNNVTANAVPENAAAGSPVGVTAFSKTMNGNAAIYSLTNNAGGRFSINAASGIVTTAAIGLDYESANMHTISVLATVGSFTSSASFVINVTDINEPPSIAGTTTFSIPENISTVTTVSATDPENSALTYSIASSADAARFSVTPQGILTFQSPPDFENPTDADGNNIYVVTVRVSDGILFTNATFNITITDLNEVYFENYAFRKSIILNTPLLGITTDQINFPALLRIQDDALIIRGDECTDKVNSAATPNFAFVDPLNLATELNYEIESYDASTGLLSVWVKVPVLTAAAAKELYFYFGSNTVLNAHDDAFTRATWSNVTSGQKSYKGVWHFNPASTNAPQYMDATGNNNSLTSTAIGVTQNNSSHIGTGITLSGGAVAKVSASGIPANNAAYTVSLWVHYSSTPSGSANLVSLQNATAASATQIGFTSSNNLNAWRWGSSGSALAKTSRPATGTWHHIVYSYSGSTSSLYVNGVLANSSSSVAPQSGSPNLIAFGDYYTATNTPGNEPFRGSIDEAQIIDVALSADWIKASFNNQKNPTAFTTNGPTTVTSPATAAALGYLSYTWTGAQNSAVNNVNNWANSTAGVILTPVLSSKATWNIPSGLSNYPVLDGNYTVNGLNISAGASINLNGHNLSVACNLSNNGQIIYNSHALSKLTFNGTMPTQTYTGTSNANSCLLGTLEIDHATSGTVILNGGLVQVHNLVSVTRGTLNANGNLTLKASASSVASVGPLTGTAIVGNVHVETFFTGGTASHRSTRIIASPINDTNLSSKTFGQLKNQLIITGPGGIINGFDPGSITQPFAVSLTKYNEPARANQSQFTNIPNINTALPAGQAAFLFYRGTREGYSAATAAISKKVNTPFMTPENAVVTYTGPINQGNIHVNLSYTNNSGDARNGYNLVGNPYPAVINWENVTRVNVINELKIIKPTGGYATYMDGISINANELDLKYIQPGQGFYTRASSTGASITFRESSKSVTSAPVRLLNNNQSDVLLAFSGMESHPRIKSKTDKPKQLRLSLHDGANAEEAVSVFKEGNNLLAGSEDALFFGGSSVSLSFLSSDNVKLVINSMPELDHVKELKFSVTSIASGPVKLNFNDLSATEGFTVVLEDNYLRKLTEIKNAQEYPFAIDLANPASYGDDRFKLTFTPRSLSPLGLSDFMAKTNTSNVLLTWKTSFENNFEGFEIERSADSENFTSIGKHKGQGLASAYKFTDGNPMAGDNYYRLKQIDKDGALSYSKIVKAQFNFSSMQFSVFPNPATDKIMISVTDRSSLISLSIYDLSGKELKNKQFNKQDAIEVSVKDLVSGIYVIKIFNSGNEILGTAKLIKN